LRPAFSVLSSQKLTASFQLDVPCWRVAVQDTLKELLSKNLVWLACQHGHTRTHQGCELLRRTLALGLDGWSWDMLNDSKSWNQLSTFIEFITQPIDKKRSLKLKSEVYTVQSSRALNLTLASYKRFTVWNPWLVRHAFELQDPKKNKKPALLSNPLKSLLMSLICNKFD